MWTPGFTAEAALYRSTGSYRGRSVARREGVSLMPQQLPLPAGRLPTLRQSCAGWCFSAFVDCWFRDPLCNCSHCDRINVPTISPPELEAWRAACRSACNITCRELHQARCRTQLDACLAHC
jgi:hypothetical protein